jgi:hypothetical protein
MHVAVLGKRDRYGCISGAVIHVPGHLHVVVTKPLHFLYDRDKPLLLLIAQLSLIPSQPHRALPISVVDNRLGKIENGLVVYIGGSRSPIWALGLDFLHVHLLVVNHEPDARPASIDDDFRAPICMRLVWHADSVLLWAKFTFTSR